MKLASSSLDDIYTLACTIGVLTPSCSDDDDDDDDGGGGDDDDDDCIQMICFCSIYTC